MVFMYPSSPKAGDLRQDGRYALHSTVVDSEGTGGEFLARGRARLIEDPAVRREPAEAGYAPRDEYILFEFSVEAAFGNTYSDGRPHVRTWRSSAPGAP